MKKSFSLSEVLTAVVILTILITIGIPISRSVVEQSRSKVCETNLRAIGAAIEIFTLEREQLPASLSQLQKQHIQKGWAKTLEHQNSFLFRLASFIASFSPEEQAHAEISFFKDFLEGDLKAITCPLDQTPPPSGVSYGINQKAVSMPLEAADYNKKMNPYGIMIADCDQVDFTNISELSFRHTDFKSIFTKSNYASALTFNLSVLRITPDGKAYVVNEGRIKGEITPTMDI